MSHLSEKVVYVPGQSHLVTFLLSSGICSVSGKTVEEMLAEYPGAVVMSYNEAEALINAAIAAKYLTGPKEITVARFLEMLNLLPPRIWVTHCNTETFLLSELVIKNIGTFFARIGDRYFEINAPTRTLHQEIIVLILEAFAPAARKIEEV